MSDVVQGFLICMGIALGGGTLLGLALVVCAWHDRWRDRRYPRSPEEVSWENHVATTPGVLDTSDEGMGAFEADCAALVPVYDVDDWPGDAS